MNQENELKKENPIFQACWPTLEINGFELIHNGWNGLLKNFFDYVANEQTRYVKRKDFDSYESPGVPIFNFATLQIKQKFGYLRVYWNLAPIELDWDIFCRESYYQRISQIKERIFGYCSAIGSLSGKVCEISGNIGESRNINGWFMTLSDAEYNKIIKETKPCLTFWTESGAERDNSQS